MAETNQKKTRQQNRQYWQQHDEACRRSGLTRTAYCSRHNLNVKTFAYWRHRLKAAEAATILSQLSQYKKISDEYKLAVETQPDFIQIAATASPADKAVWPNKPLIIVLAAMAGLCFSSLLVLLRNPGKTL